MTSLSDYERQQILDALRAGKKIEAIKLYRESTGQGLKESKDFIDELTLQLHQQAPQSVPVSKSGCGTAVVAFVLTAGLGILYTIS